MNREQSQQLTRDKIYKSALYHFSEASFKEVSVNQICTEAGVSKGIVYHHFKDKNTLYTTCLEDSIHYYLSYLDEHIKIKGDFNTDLEHYFSTREAYFRNDDAYSKLYQRALYETPESMRDSFKEYHSVVVEYNRGLLRKLLNDADLQDSYTIDEVIQYFEMVIESYQRRDISELEGSHEDQIRRVLKLLCYGILRR